MPNDAQLASRPTSGRDQRGSWVEPSMYYLADLSVKPVVYNPPPGAGTAPRRLGNYAHFPVRAHDARPNAASISLTARASG